MKTEALYFNYLLSVLYTYVEKEEQGIELTKEEREYYVNIVEKLRDNNIQIPFGIEI